MDRATRTLVISLARRTGPVLLCQMALTALLCFLLRDIQLDLGQRGFRPQGDLRTFIPTGSEEFLMSLLLTGVNAFVAAGSVLLLHSDAKRLKIGLPMRILLLPMPYSRMVLAHMIFGAAAVGATVAVASTGGQWALDSPIAWWLPVCFCTAANATLQAWAFTLAERRGAIALGSLVGAVLVFSAAIRIEMVGMWLTTSPPAVLAGMTAAWIALCCAATVRFGRDMRYSGFDVTPGRRGEVRESAPFASPFRAQLWYEWRRVGWVLPAAATAGLIGFFIGMPIVVALFKGSDITGESSWVGYSKFFRIQWGTSVHMIVTALHTTAVGASVLSGAYAVMLSGEWQGRSTFLPSRPMRTSRLGFARIATMFLSALLTVGAMMLLTLIIGAAVGLDSTMPEVMKYLRIGYEHVPAPLILAFFWGTIFIALWLGLWISDCAIALAVYAAVAAPFLAIGWLTGGGWESIRIPVWIGSFTCLAAAAGVAMYAYSQGLVSRSRFAVAAGVYVAYVSVFVYYGLNYRPANIQGVVIAQDWAIPFPHPIDWPLWMGISVLPIIPLFSYPLLLSRWRTAG